MITAVAVVTDSTACLPAELAAGAGVRVVPLRVILGGRAVDEDPAAGGTDDSGAGGGVSGTGGGERPDGPERAGDADRDPDSAVTAGQVAAVLRAAGRVSTASPTPARFAAAYAAAATAGAQCIVSVHLSARLSGTLGSARLAAARAPVPVRLVDSRSIGMGLGIAVLTAAEAARAGAGIEDVAAAAASRAAGLRSVFALDTPAHLQAGGRLELSQALPATGLTARPLLHIRDGRIAPLEKARTLAAAIGRLEQLAVEFAADQPVDLAVQHAGEAGRAAGLAGRLAQRIPRVRHAYLAAAGPVICAHTGPRMLGVVIAPV